MTETIPNLIDAMTPLEEFVAQFLFESYEEEYGGLDDAAQAFVESSTPEEQAALVQAIDEATQRYGSSAEWPVALWPFEDDEGAPAEALSVVREVLTAAV